VYSTKINGEVISFGTSGWLYQSNKLMYDRGTKTLWHQFLGKPAVGELVGSGIELEVLPVTLTTWDDWVAAYPDTTVLNIETGVYSALSYRVEEDRSSIYSSYRRSDETMFPVPVRSDRLSDKSRILGLTLNGRSKAYPDPVLKQTPVINDSLAGTELVVVTIGGGSRVYETSGRIFKTVSDEGSHFETYSLVDQEGETWEITEEALISFENPESRLDRLPSRSAFWFGWFAFHPSTEVYQPVLSAP